MPYVTGGLGREWHEVVRAVVDAGADAVEVGIPFSDPIMDGRTIQEASQRALDLGATPIGVIDAMATIDVPAPLVVMTYYNLVARLGHERCAQHLRQCGVDGAIVPDLPYDELDGWGDAADAAGVETVLLAAPTTPDDRLREICERSHGFVYGVSLMGVTGERATSSPPRGRDGPALQGGHRQAGPARRRHLDAGAGCAGGRQRRRRDRGQRARPAAARRRRARRGRGFRPIPAGRARFRTRRRLTPNPGPTRSTGWHSGQAVGQRCDDLSFSVTRPPSIPRS